MDVPSTTTVAERYGAAWEANDLEAIMALQGRDMVFRLHAEGFEPAVGADAVRAQFAYFFEAWDKLSFETNELRVTDELFTNQYRFSAELVLPFPMGGEVIEPSGRRAEIEGVDVITVRDGLVRTKHTYVDTLAMRRQLRGE